MNGRKKIEDVRCQGCYIRVGLWKAVKSQPVIRKAEFDKTSQCLKMEIEPYEKGT